MDPNCPPKTLDDVPGRQPAWPALLILVAVAGATWCVYTVVYNLYFHPLARFPGPPAAAATGYWKAWIECVLEKSFVHELEVLHARYGRVVRVGPNEVCFVYADQRIFLSLGPHPISTLSLGHKLVREHGPAAIRVCEVEISQPSVGQPVVNKSDVNGDVVPEAHQCRGLRRSSGQRFGVSLSRHIRKSSTEVRSRGMRQCMFDKGLA